MSVDKHIEALATAVVQCGFEIHNDLGPGLFESAYETLLAELLSRDGFAVRKQVPLPLRYKGVLVENAYKIDLLIENRLLVELKSVERLMPVHGKQVLTYLRLGNLPLGLLMNFGDSLFKNGLRRIANDYYRHKGPN